jgi:hypothetical protein
MPLNNKRHETLCYRRAMLEEYPDGASDLGGAHDRPSKVKHFHKVRCMNRSVGNRFQPPIPCENQT